MRAPRLPPVLFALAVLGCVTPLAHAEGGDDLKFTASLGLLHDDNLFRLSSGANAQALIGRSSTAETVHISSVGLTLDKTYSLQRVELDLDLTRYDYQNFGYLSYTARNYRAAWRWSYTPHTYGNFTSNRSESLNSFVDFRGFNVRNLRVDSATRFDATHELDARWRLLAGIASRSTRNAQAVVAEDSDTSAYDVNVGVRYVLPTGSSAGYVMRHTSGSYLGRKLPSPGLLDTDYDQTDNELKLSWVVSPSVNADFQVGLRSRHHPNYPQRDFSGVTSAANVQWSYSPKSALVASWTRELGAYQTLADNYVVTNRVSAGPIWQVGTKTSLRAQYAVAQREYAGNTGVLPPSQRRDTTRDASVTLDWQPYTFMAISASLQNSRRASNLAGVDYNSNLVNLSAQFSF